MSLPTDRETHRARMPADVDAPDKVAYGLTFRQLAILAVVALAFYGAWRGLHTVVPGPVLVGAAVIVGGLSFGIAVGRRDGLPLDVWLLAAIRHSRAPRALSTTDTASATPDWVRAPKNRVMVPAPLALPADAIDDGGEIRLGATRAAMVAATSVNLALRTADEQAALVDTFGRWLNSLSTPTQIVVSAQPVDLRSAARSLSQAVDGLAHPALADAAGDHARFLDDLATRRDPLRRQVLIVTRTNNGERGDHAARRRADDTVRTLSGLGVTTRALNGAAVTAAIAAAADPYRPSRPGGLAAPDAVITGPDSPPRQEKGPR
ncbi:PrgI family protein [Micromonospora sp. HUAS LYJ1]|uniref:PrgI family protein n=1 Tax=Micromonospora sp. HUAS LYJ1 TaxID=3061626 RepID=UPI002673B7E7|nr:PrgI family protein [Micromonospora sp. HUAS LYJ1]WKU03441.1 PrgI family protein [Micromonospora sp. HUAS LYJ1]